MVSPPVFPPIAFNARITELERLRGERHALLSARVSITWTAVPPVDADVKATFLPDASYGCSLIDCTVDSTGITPLISTRFRLENPLPFNVRAQLFGVNLLEQGDQNPPNPIVGVIVFPSARQVSDPTLSHMVNVVNGALTPGTKTVFDLHIQMIRGDLR